MHFSSGPREFIVRRLTALGRETADQRNGALTSSCLRCLKARTIAKETEGNAADVIFKARWGGHTRHVQEANRRLYHGARAMASGQRSILC
jgi:hypothetical protein